MLNKRSSIIVPLLLLFIAQYSGPALAAGADPALKAAGKKIYMRECAACHGVEGDGAGPGAYILNPRPRNLQLGVFKLRSTPTGENPTDQDLFKTITRGISSMAGAMMPSFQELPAKDRWALVTYVKAVAGIDKAGKPIDLPTKPRSFDLALGRQVYERLQCAACHGVDGLGDGTSSLTLKDAQKRRIWAPDLSRGQFKGGAMPRDIYTRISTGLDGTPMPAYASKAKPNEIWALSGYVLSLSKKNIND